MSVAEAKAEEKPKIGVTLLTYYLTSYTTGDIGLTAWWPGSSHKKENLPPNAVQSMSKAGWSYHSSRTKNTISSETRLLFRRLAEPNGAIILASTTSSCAEETSIVLLQVPNRETFFIDDNREVGEQRQRRIYDCVRTCLESRTRRTAVCMWCHWYYQKKQIVKVLGKGF